MHNNFGGRLSKVIIIMMDAQKKSLLNISRVTDTFHWACTFLIINEPQTHRMREAIKSPGYKKERKSLKMKGHDEILIQDPGIVLINWHNKKLTEQIKEHASRKSNLRQRIIEFTNRNITENADVCIYYKTTNKNKIINISKQTDRAHRCIRALCLWWHLWNESQSKTKQKKTFSHTKSLVTPLSCIMMEQRNLVLCHPHPYIYILTSTVHSSCCLFTLLLLLLPAYTQKYTESKAIKEN